MTEPTDAHVAGETRNESSTRRRRRWAIGFVICLGGLAAVWVVIAFAVRPEYAVIPEPGDVVNEHDRNDSPAFDLWGKSISRDEAEQADADSLSAANGAVAIDDATLQLGHDTFYGETFGNENFLSDVVGILEGPVTAMQLAKALWNLGGEGTTNLRVTLGETATIGGRKFEEGTEINTGLDVPKGAYAPLGMVVKYDGGRFKAGITCAACHSTVDPETKLAVHGAPNSDINAGLLLALAPNSAAYFVHANITSLDEFAHEGGPTVQTSDGRAITLPDVASLEEAVDKVFLNWPPGSFDSMTDLKADPTQIPSSFTRGGHPYGWSGFAAAGPFHGLSALNNNVHALNSDALSHADAMLPLFGIDKELYLATALQNAAHAKYRFDPRKDIKPSDFFKQVDPTPGVPGMNEMIALPTFPKGSVMSPDGLWISSPGYRAWQQVNGMSAWQNSLTPPPPPLEVSDATRRHGRAVFEKARCAECHSGAYLTNNLIIPAKKIGSQPVRATALKATETVMAPPVIYSFDTRIDELGDAKTLTVPTDDIDPEQTKLAFAWGDSNGGYKVPALIGLYWTAPYLHDGGIAVGKDADSEFGLPATLLKHLPVDPAHSLRALIDARIRQRVVESNCADDGLQMVNVAGTGHEFWVDSPRNFTAEDQRALIDYLLTATPDDDFGVSEPAGHPRTARAK